MVVTAFYSYRNISNYQTCVVFLILHPRLILQWSEHHVTVSFMPTAQLWFYIEIESFLPSPVYSILRVYLHIGHPTEENQQHVSRFLFFIFFIYLFFFFFKINQIKEWLKKFVALLTKKKQLRMNGKTMTLDFLQALYSVKN